MEKKVLHKTMSYRYADSNFIRVTYRYAGKIHVVNFCSCIITNFTNQTNYELTIKEALEQEEAIISMCNNTDENKYPDNLYENLYLGEEIIITDYGKENK